MTNKFAAPALVPAARVKKVDLCQTYTADKVHDRMTPLALTYRERQGVYSSNPLNMASYKLIRVQQLFSYIVEL